MIISESDIAGIVNRVVSILKEDYLYHYGKGIDMDNPEPYHSEGRGIKFEGGHETGSFGSGTYFRSEFPFDNKYNDADRMEMTRAEMYQRGKRFIKIRTKENGGSLYRVDTSFYSNLYKLKSEKEGDLLKKLMTDVNTFCQLFNRGDSREYANMRERQQIYLKIVEECKKIGLNLPWKNYKGFCEFAQKYCADKSLHQTPATIFMELNGYNGVDASYAGRYDSFWEGSVIYDLNKVKGDIEPVKNPRDEWAINGYNMPTMYSDIIDNERDPSYFKRDDTNVWKKDDPQKILKALKRYGMVLAADKFRMLTDDLKQAYLKVLYQNISRGYINLNFGWWGTTNGVKELCEDEYIDAIIKYQMVGFVNVNEKVASRIFDKLASDAYWDGNEEEAMPFIAAYKDGDKLYKEEIDYLKSMYDRDFK